MYAPKLDAERLVGECVDIIRRNTNATLADCQNSLNAVLSALELHFGSQEFSDVRRVSESYKINAETCYDRKLLNSICTRLYDLFLEKQELSYSSSQDDLEFCQNLKIFSDATLKTDPRIPLAVISDNNYDWIYQMLSVLQMEQSSDVRHELMCALQSLMDSCGKTIKKVFLETQLVAVLTEITSRIVAEESTNHLRLQTIALHLLACMYSTRDIPPLSHLDHINTGYVGSILRASKNLNGCDIFDLFSNFAFLMESNNLPFTTIYTPLQETPSDFVDFGLVVISELNKNSNVARLHYLRNILLMGGDVVNNLFYANDLRVLAHVLAREMINHSEKEVRELCLKCILIMMDEKIVENDAEVDEAIANYSEI